MKKYGAIIKKQVWIPGDERSRTHPGHGYPEGYETHIEFREFRNESEMKSFVKNESRPFGNPNFRIIQFEELNVSTEVVVKVATREIDHREGNRG